MYKLYAFMALGAVLTAGDTRGGYQKLPLIFEPNLGQTDSRVRYMARGGGYTLYLTDLEAVLSLRGAEPVKMSLVGGTKPKELERLEPTGGISNYFIGSDPSKWRTNVPHYQRVKYRGVYPGVDLVYYGKEGKLEYDLLVAPGADASRIEIAYQGVESLRVDGNGDLLLKTAFGELVQQKPLVYQEVSGKRIEVAARYLVEGRKQVSFELARYDHSKRLVIDPVLIYSSYLGGTGNDLGNAIAVDSNGNSYVAGYTTSANFPTTSAFQPSYGGGNDDVFVTKVNATGSAKVYSTFLGGSGDEVANAIAVDAAGNAYVAGITSSTNFPTVSPLQASNGGGTDAFVAKLNSAGSALTYSTYLGGTDNEQAYGIALDGSGNAYVTGYTFSTDFPTVSAFQAANGGALDAFVTKINASGSAKVYSSYLGGSANDQGTGIAVDSAGNAYVTGFTFSTNFPTVNPIQATNTGVLAFVTKVNATGSAKLYSTYLGGTGNDEANAIAVDSSGNAYVTGYTGSTDFPVTANVIQTTSGGGKDAFVTKIATDGSSKLYSTYLGGSNDDVGTAIAVDAGGNAYVTGYTFSTNFPVASPLQATNGGGLDAFVTKLNAAGTIKSYSTYFGGSNSEQAQGIAVDGAGNAYVTGGTLSSNLTTLNPFQASNANAATTDAFVFSISASNSAPPTLVSVNPSSGTGSTQTFSFVVSDSSGFTDVPWVQMLFNSSLTGLAGCYTHFDRASNAVLLLNDAATGWIGPATVGVPGTLSNNQCTVNAQNSSSSGVGSNLTINLSITFNPSFGGTKIIWMQSVSNGGMAAIWQQMGSWTPFSNQAPSVISVTPSSGTGSVQTFSYSYSDPNGYTDIPWVQMIVNTTLSGSAACYTHYDRASNAVLLLNDAATGWLGPITVGTVNTLQNSQCIVNAQSSSASGSGSTLTVNLNYTFKSPYIGTKNIYMQTQDTGGLATGWQLKGTWTVNGPQAPVAVSVTPSSGSGSSQTFSFLYSDANGYGDMPWAQMLINSSLSGASACYTHYDRAFNTVLLLNDAGTAWLGPITLGTASTLQNSQCTLNAQTSSVSGSGTNLTVNLSLTFKPAFAGAKNVYMQTQDTGGTASGWQQRGTWTAQ